MLLILCLNHKVAADSKVIAPNGVTLELFNDESYGTEEDSSLKITDLRINTDASPQSMITIKISSSTGAIYFPNKRNVFFLQGNPIKRSSIYEIRGRVASIQDMVKVLSYFPAENFFGEDSLSITVTLQQQNSMFDPPFAVSTSSVSRVIVSPKNDAPQFLSFSNSNLIRCRQNSSSSFTLQVKDDDYALFTPSLNQSDAKSQEPISFYSLTVNFT